jgi:hypothetical protein
VLKNKVRKLNLRRETVAALELQEVSGGSPFVVLNSQASVCYPCYRPRFTDETTWPQTVGNPGTSVVNPVGF